jgi:ribosome biogenesis GTPase
MDFTSHTHNSAHAHNSASPNWLRLYGFSTAFAPPAEDARLPARILFHSQEHYRIITADGERDAHLAGRLRHLLEFPVVGDWVLVAGQGSGPLRIEELLPRKTCLSRKVPGEQTLEQVVAANVDTVFMVMGLDGDFNLRRLERFAVMVWNSGAQPVAVLTKADLHEDPAAARLDALAVAPGIAVATVSSIRGEGLEPLGAYLSPGRTVALVGSSGAGKSTLLNRLCGKEIMRTGDVRSSDDRGRHTTTHRQLILLPTGGLLIDNPGVREIQLWANEEALTETFSDLETLAASCRFRNCRHEAEPGCAVQLALREGRLSEARLQSWRKLEKELRHLERQQNVAASRKEDKRLGRHYKRIQAAKRTLRRDE